MEWWKTAKVGDELVVVRRVPFVEVGGSSFFKRIKLYRARPKVGFVFKVDDIEWRHGKVFFKPPNSQFILSYQILRPVSKRNTDTGMRKLKSILQGAPVDEVVS